MAATRFSGAYTALVTPFTEDASDIDWDAYDELVEFQLAGGVAGLVPCGTTGEAPTLSAEEQRQLVQRTVALAKGKATVVAGTGSNSTQKTIETSNAALEAGADGVMIMMPYYNKPSQDGMVRHVELVAKAVSAPIVLYNIPGRTGVELSVESLLRILEVCDNVVGIKDATGNVFHGQEVQRLAGDRIAVLSGDDPLTLPLMSVGATGVISVTSNVYPKQVSACVADALAGRWREARRKHLALLPVHRALFMEPNPQPTKAALARKGRMHASLRPPMLEASDACKRAVAEVLAAYEASLEAS
jgi:4-hydroxy-tetrahydrodipicolinate synthase